MISRPKLHLACLLFGVVKYQKPNYLYTKLGWVTSRRECGRRQYSQQLTIQPHHTAAFTDVTKIPNNRKSMKTQVQSTTENTNYVSVAEFYAGKSVFITGATGFVGKVLLEKLLYSCKDIDNIFILIREKKGVNAEQRVEEMFDKPLFSRLKTARPQDFKKIIPIIGHLNQPDLGISPADEKILLEKVSVVFHIAATVNFDEKLSVAVATNFTGTKYVLNLCQRMKNIKVFMHVSTAYCNTDKKILEEKVYPPPAELGEVLKFLEQPHHDEKQIKVFLKGLPNTYAFSKALTEHYVAENHGNVPTIIVRPSSVSASVAEPLEGWVDSWSSATGIITATVKGALRVLHGDANNILDLIPVDYVANLSIAAAARCNSSDDVTVYNCCTSSCNPLTLKQIYEYIKKHGTKNGYNDGAQIMAAIINNKFLVSSLTLWLQIVPAYIADLFLRAKGKKPKYMKIQSKLVYGRDLHSFFTSNSWEMKADGTRALYTSLSADDRYLFPFNPSDINWDEYVATYLGGIERFLIKKNVTSSKAILTSKLRKNL